MKERILFLFMTLVVLIPYGTPLVTLAETLDHSLTVTLASLEPSEAAKEQVTLSLSVDNQSDETQSVVLNSDQALTADQALSENLPTGVTAALVQEKQLQVTVAPKVKDTVKLVTSVKDSAAASVSFSYQAQKLTALLKDSEESATKESETTVPSAEETTTTKESSVASSSVKTEKEETSETSQPVQKKAAKAVMKAAAAPQATAATAGRDITTLPHAKDLFDSKDGKTIFTTADLSKKVGNDWVSVDGKDIQLNDTLLLQYQWELPESIRKEMKAGDIFNFHLPEKFAVQGDKELTGQLVNDKGTVFGDFVIQKDGSVVITFTKAVETNSGIKGTLNVAGQVDQSKIDNPGDEDVTIPFTDDDKHVTPNIVVPNAQALSKEVATKTSDADIQNNQATVNWKITANKTGAPLTNGKLSESLPAGVTYAGNLKIQSYEVDLTNGSLKAGTGKDVAYDSSAIKNGASAFEINLPDTDHLAYVVSFDTTVDFGKIEKNDENTPPTAASPSAKVTNHVKLTSKENNDLDAHATATFGSASTVQKSLADFDKQKNLATWQVAFTKKGLDLPGGTTLVDTLSSGQKLTDENGQEITDLNQLSEFLTKQLTGKNAGKRVTVTKNANGTYNLTFPDGIAESFTLNYYSSVPQNVTSYSNGIKWNGKGNTVNEGFEKPGSGVVKSFIKDEETGLPVHNQDGKVTWQVVINKENLQLDSWYIIDTLTNSTIDGPKNLTITEVPKGKTDSEGVTVPAGDYALSNVKKNSFRIDYKKATNSKFILTYESDYTVGTDPNKTVSNKANYHYVVNGKDWSNDGNSSFKPFVDKRKQIGGNKGGNYNPVTGEVTWTIAINTSKLAFGANAVLTDPIPAGQTYVEGSAKAYLANDENKTLTFQYVKPNESLSLPPVTNLPVSDTKDPSVTAEKNPNGTLVVTGFPEGSKDTYKIVFRTKVGNGDSLAEGTAKNTASYADSSNQPFDVSGSVSFTNKDQYINKSHSSLGSDKSPKTIHYTVDVNKEKLPLRNVKVVDNNWVNLKVDPTTIKVTDSKGNVLTKDDYELVTEEQQFTVIFKIQNKDAQGKLVYEINDSYKVEYDADVLYNGNPGDPIKLSNDVQITGDNIQEGHKDDNDNLTVNVPAAGGSAQGEVRQLAITKVDDETNAALAGANVTLYRGKPADNQKVVTKDTDKNGVVTFDNLTYDTYYLVENTAPAGYYISPELKAGMPFEINGDTDKVNGKLGTVTNQKVGGIKLTKTDSVTGAKLEGATFELFQDGKQVAKDALGNDLGELKTDKDGILTIKNLIPGDYVVKEVGAPTGYHVTATDNAETVKPGATTEVTVKNDINKGQISFQKSSEGKLLKDAEFTLYDENGKAVDVQTSDANGLVTFDLEANHTYSVKETKNPAGYSGSYDLNEIKVTADGVVAYGAKGTKVGNNPIAVSNDLIKTQLKVTKEWALNENDPDFVQPKSVEVTLKRQDHTGLKTVVGSADLTADNQWSFTFQDLEKYDLTSPLNDKGEHAEYGYSIEESAVPGFKADISKAAESDDNSGLTVALTNTLVPTEVDGTKKWDQKAIDAGLVPDSLQVKLQYSLDGTSWNDYPDGTQKITKADGWNYHYEKLPTYTYQNGTAQKLQYRVTEVAVPKGFVQDFAKGSYDITNTLDLHKIKVVKTWDDQSDAFGVRPDDLQVTLMVKKGNDWVTYESVFHAKKELTLTADNKWQGEFTDLPQYDAEQNEIQYAVQENLGDNAKTYVPNGKVEGTQTAEVGATLDGTANLINHLNTVNLSIDKKWSDFDDTYQTRPDLITFQLLAQSGDGAAAPVTRDHPNGEYQIKGPDFKTLSIKDLPKYDKKGNLITYSVKETNIAQNYQETPKYEGTDNSLSITNILETTKVTISKKWDEVGNLAYARPEVRLQLFRQAGEDGEKEAMTDKEGTKNFIKVIAAGSTADWSYTFENLPAKDKDGTPYSYSVKEISENNNYHVSYPDSLTVLNTLNVKKIVIDKHWEDQHNLFDSRPDMVEFELYVTDSTGERPFVVGEDHHQLIQTVNVKEGDDWTRTFDNLPAQDVDGSELTYSVKEVVKDADGNVLTPNYTSENDGARMINKLVTTEISGTKTWNDQDNQFNSRPESIKVQLLQNGKALKGEQFVKTVTADDNWQYTFSDLPKVDRTGVDYQYTVEEISTPANYETTVDGMNLTNKLLTTSVKGEKTWSDQDNKYQTRPESIKVQLLQNGQALTDKEFTKTVTAKDNWHYQFTDLPKVDPTGKEYLYTVQEVSAPANYQVKASGMDLENSLVTTQLSGKKIWVDNHDQDNLRPDAIKVALLQNGKQLAVTTVTEADNWKYSFTDLPKLDQKGQAYVYTLKELNVPKGYTATVDGNNLVNTHKPNVPNKPKIPKTPNDKTKKPRRMFPRTNDTVQPIVTVLGLVIILAAGVIVVYRRRKQL